MSTFFLNHIPFSNVNEFVETAIANIDCVEEITPELIQAIRCQIGRTLPIPAFPVTLNKYLEWEAKQPQESLQGFDYDERLERFVLRPRLMLPARGALKGIVHWMRTAIGRLGDDNPKGWSIVQNKPYRLTGDYDGIVKRPQTALIMKKQSWPLVVVYADTNETETEVLDNVKQWLYGSNGEVKLVVLITTQEQNAPPFEGSWLDGLDCRLWRDPNDLAKLIYEVESKEERPGILGQVIASVWLLAPENCCEDANHLPSDPFYKFTCDLRSGSYTGSVSDFFMGVSFVDAHNHLLLENVAAPFPFQAFDEFFKRGVWQYLRDRSLHMALRAWNDHHQRRRQEEMTRAAHGLDDLQGGTFALAHH